MIAVAAGMRVLVATKPVDFRKGADGLVALVREALGHDPFAGTIFVFRSKRADRLKILVWDGSGLVLVWKRLENGAFRWPPISDGVMRSRVQLLILDDWGLAPLTSQQGRDLLEIVDGRHGRSSTIVTSQLPVDHWHEVIVDPTIADAVLDRLVHTAHRLTLDGETLRKPPEKSAKRGKLDTDAAE